MKKILLLAFERRKELVDDEHLLDGYIKLHIGDESVGESAHVRGFEGLTYAKMIGLFARAARDNLYCDLGVLRLDQSPTPITFQLSDDQAAQLREDPMAYIQATSPRLMRARSKGKRYRD